MKLRAALLSALTAVLLGGVSHARAAGDEVRNWLVGIEAAGKLGALVPELEGLRLERFESFRGVAVRMTEAEANALRSAPGVRFVEPDYERHLHRARRARGPARGPLVQAENTARAQATPWGIGHVRASNLWEHSRGATIRVAVVDTGIDYNHPDFRKVYPRRARGATRPAGIDFVNGDGDPMDDHGHGTHVAGTIAAVDNAFGVVGVAPEVELYAIKVLRPLANGSATGSVSSIIKAVDWAISNGIHVLNFSLGSDEPSQAEREAFEEAWEAGILSIASTGNGYDPDEPIEGIGYPAAYPNVVAVGAIDEVEAIASFSQRGTQIALVAPGVRVLSTLPVGSSQVADALVDGSPLLEVEPVHGSPLGAVTSGFVDCGTGNISEIPATVAGRIALIRRGGTSATTPSGFTFNEKVRNAKSMGAAAVIIYNHDNSPLSWTLIRSNALGSPLAEDLSFEWPLTLAITKTDGEALLQKPASVLAISSTPYDYGTLQGTSMASPHVAGVAALIWSLAPDATAAQVRNALVTGARDLGPEGWDSTYGFGIVDAVRSAEVLAPERLPAD
ncbi:MAG TPA: S8 family serine peptidase [Thermoanaerobaculia bacterium]|nr:S8 family serine peptidase [Thermoanaerobaculia bacterium]